MAHKHTPPGLAFASAAALLFTAGCTTPGAEQGASPAAATPPVQTAQVMCAGINSCAGHSECKTATSACKGQNGCAGQGWSYAPSAENCVEHGGTVL